MPRSAEECRGVRRSGEDCGGLRWCGEECRGVRRSAEETEECRGIGGVFTFLSFRPLYSPCVFPDFLPLSSLSSSSLTFSTFLLSPHPPLFPHFPHLSSLSSLSFSFLAFLQARSVIPGGHLEFALGSFGGHGFALDSYWAPADTRSTSNWRFGGHLCRLSSCWATLIVYQVVGGHLDLLSK